MENTREYFEHHKKYYLNNLPCKCANCGSTDNLYLHHIVPLTLGGTNNLSNIVPLCSNCHSKVHGTKATNISELTKKGIREAKKRGSRIGNSKGDTLVTKKSIEAKEIIRKYSKDYNGNLHDKEVMKLCGVSRNSYYKYKKELSEV